MNNAFRISPLSDATIVSQELVEHEKTVQKTVFVSWMGLPETFNHVSIWWKIPSLIIATSSHSFTAELINYASRIQNSPAIIFNRHISFFKLGIS